MYEYLRKLLEQTFRVTGEIEPEKSFDDLEVDSLTTAEICAALEDDLKVTIDDKDVTQETTLAELADLLERNGAVLSR